MRHPVYPLKCEHRLALPCSSHHISALLIPATPVYQKVIQGNSGSTPDGTVATTIGNIGSGVTVTKIDGLLFTSTEASLPDGYIGANGGTVNQFFSLRSETNGDIVEKHLNSGNTMDGRPVTCVVEYTKV
jgi:hypothetical protein